MFGVSGIKFLKNQLKKSVSYTPDSACAFISYFANSYTF